MVFEPICISVTFNCPYFTEKAIIYINKERLVSVTLILWPLLLRHFWSDQNETKTGRCRISWVRLLTIRGFTWTPDFSKILRKLDYLMAPSCIMPFFFESNINSNFLKGINLLRIYFLRKPSLKPSRGRVHSLVENNHDSIGTTWPILK